MWPLVSSSLLSSSLLCYLNLPPIAACWQLRKAARAAQDEVQAARAADETAFARKEKEAKELERQKMEAEATAKAAKAKARAERLAKAAEEKAAFEARVEEKRMRSA